MNETTPGRYPALPYNKSERELAKLETSWADHARRLRTGAQVRSEPPWNHRPRSLVTVQREFEYYREQFRAGERAALIRALRLAGAENLPLPYWLADGIAAALDQLSAPPFPTMLAVFGLEKYYPETPKGPVKVRSDNRRKLLLYEAVYDLRRGGIGKTSAIKQAAARLHIGFRTAGEWFNEVDGRQQNYLRFMDGRKLHKSR